MMVELKIYIYIYIVFKFIIIVIKMGGRREAKQRGTHELNLKTKLTTSWRNAVGPMKG